MSTAIIGLASSGKTTLFNALTRGSVHKGVYGASKPINVGIGSKPDSRLEHLDRAFQSRRKVRAEMEFWDMPTDYQSGALFSGETLTSLQKARALLIVARGFGDPAIPHPSGSIDWVRDVESILFEIVFADIALVDRRVERIQDGMKSLKSSERPAALAKTETLKSIQSKLESGTAVRSDGLSETERRVAAESFMLSALPLTIAVNIDESDADGDPSSAIAEGCARLSENAALQNAKIAPICATIEEELRGLDDAESTELRMELGLKEDASETLMDACLSSLSTLTFYTASDREVRAWHFPDGYKAPEAAGIVHSDMERGFIRAEVVAFDDFVDCGSMVEARRRGVFRQEGRDYQFSDGDIVNFLFSV